jgi:orotate phosphoribosyltransferase
MTYETQSQQRSDVWAATADLTTLRQQLLDLFCQLAYKEGDFVLFRQRSSYYINGKHVTLHPEGL